MSPQDIKQHIGRALSGVRQALRGKLARLTDKQVMLAQVEGVAGELFQDAEVFQQAGLRSKPLAGAQVIVVPLHGSSAHGVVIACANGKLHVANMQDGETAIFNEKEGHFIHLKNGKIIRIECDKLEVVAPLATFSGKVEIASDATVGGSAAVAQSVTAGLDITAGGQVADQGGAKTMGGMRAIYNSHTHNEQGNGVTTPPNQIE